MRNLTIFALIVFFTLVASGCIPEDKNGPPDTTTNQPFERDTTADTVETEEDTGGMDGGGADTGEVGDSGSDMDVMDGGGDTSDVGAVAADTGGPTDVGDTSDASDTSDAGDTSDTGDTSDAGDADGGADVDVGPMAVCGDGVIEGSEQCDDSNTKDSDGCSSACDIEPGWGCANAINLNTGSDGQGGQLAPGTADPIWNWAKGTLNMDGSTPASVPGGLTWSPATVIRACTGSWHGATPPAQWINTSGWDAAQSACSPHPNPMPATLRYYRATFNIDNAQAAAATTLRGDLWADNQVTRIFINGTEVTEYTPPTGNQSSFTTGDVVTFGSWSSSYYQAGQNEMVIAVKNLSTTTPGNPEGLLVRVDDAFKVGSVCTMQP